MNPYYPSKVCNFCKRKAVKKFTGLTTFGKFLCKECSETYEKWFPNLTIIECIEEEE